MKFAETVTLSASNVRRHKLGSLLTSMGVAVGVAVVIAMMTLGTSFQAFYVDQYNSVFSSNAFTVAPRTSDLALTQANSGGTLYSFRAPLFSQAEVQALGELDGVREVAPYSLAGAARGIMVDEQPVRTTFTVPVTQTSANLFAEGYLKLQQGEHASTQDQVEIGYSVAQAIAIELGATNDTAYALGRQLQFTVNGQNASASIVGVLAYAPVDQSVNAGVYMPLPQEAASSSQAYNGLLVFADPTADFDAVQQAVVGYLNDGTGALTALRSTGQGLYFAPLSLSGASAFLEQQVSEYSTIILSMGVLVLLGGAVGICNIMLTSVAERTREIGVIKAIGGSKQDVVAEFMLEALLLSLLGVSIGVVGGAALGYWLTTFDILGLSLPLIYNVPWIFLSAAMGAASGLLAGVYPAWKAAKLQPVQALRAV